MAWEEKGKVLAGAMNAAMEDIRSAGAGDSESNEIERVMRMGFDLTEIRENHSGRGLDAVRLYALGMAIERALAALQEVNEMQEMIALPDR